MSGYPNYVFNTPQDREVLQRVFSYYANVYNLDAYEAVQPGFGKRVWALIENERAHDAAQAQRNAACPQCDRKPG